MRGERVKNDDQRVSGTHTGKYCKNKCIKM